MNNNFIKGFEKQSKQENKPSWYEREKGVVRAMTDNKNLGGHIGLVNWPHVKERLKKSLSHGAVGGIGGAGAGAAIGALTKGRHGIGAGALIGGLTGLAAGDAHGIYHADKKYLKDRGIDTKHLGLSHEFSPEAQAKYIDAFKKDKK